MKALSLRQPWLWAIFDLGKSIENRKWNTHYRGPILLHAAKGCTMRECDDALDWMQARGLLGQPSSPRTPTLVRPLWPGLEKLDRGGICGYAEIDGVIPPVGHKLHNEAVASFRATVHDADDRLRWHMPDQWGFVLRNVRRFPMLVYPGSLGLFEVSQDVAQIAMQARAGVCPCESNWKNIGGGHLPSCRFSDPTYAEGP